jgi:hypothetical protein
MHTNDLIREWEREYESEMHLWLIEHTSGFKLRHGDPIWKEMGNIRKDTMNKYKQKQKNNSLF